MQLEIRDNNIFAPILKKWIPLTPEEKLRQEFIIRLIENYGYSVDQLGQDIQIKNRYKADVAIWKSKGDKQKNSIPAIIITVECKADHLRIKEDDYLMGYKFASLINADFFIATNLKETKVFHVLPDNSPKKLEKLSDIPNASILLDEKTIIKYINDTKAFTRDEFSKLLFKCHNIIRNNDKLSPEAAFDEISKILFMKIMYEKKSKEEIIFSSEKFKTMEKDYEERLRPQLKINLPSLDKDFMQYLFDETKREFEDADIFDLNDQIKIRKNSFEMIVKELESFNLSDTSDDVKGIAFEQFLGKTFRGELGQFFTPRTIVDYMVEILDPEEGETICDPCCGSGGFLIKTFEFIRDKIDTDIKSKKDTIKKEYFNESYAKSSTLAQNQTDKIVQKLFEDLHEEFDIKTPGSRYFNLSHNYIYGIDANPRMARTAKMNMIMHGDGHGGVHHHDGLLPVNGIFDNRFDIILTNPPFGARVERTQRITTLDLPTQKK